MQERGEREWGLEKEEDRDRVNERESNENRMKKRE